MVSEKGNARGESASAISNDVPSSVRIVNVSKKICFHPTARPYTRWMDVSLTLAAGRDGCRWWGRAVAANLHYCGWRQALESPDTGRAVCGRRADFRPQRRGAG